MTQILLLIHSVISCAIAKGGALRERGNVPVCGGLALLLRKGTTRRSNIAHNVPSV